VSESVGYKRPPAKTRWKKGQSGNPTGKKKGTPNLRTDLIAELAEVIQINEGGKSRRISKQRALIKSLAARGIQGDTKASNLLLNLVLRMIDPEPEVAPSAPLAADDQALLDTYFAEEYLPKGSKP
jgi:hypothetical protein